MTAAESKIALALGRCSFLPGSWDKRFALGMAALAARDPEKPLTERQSTQLFRMADRYRRQLSDAARAIVMERRAAFVAKTLNRDAEAA